MPRLSPLDFIITPSVKVSYSGFSLDLSVPFNLTDNQLFKTGKAELNASYKNDFISASFNNTYDFAKSGAEYSGTESFSFTIPDPSFKDIKLTQNMKVENHFEMQSFTIGASYKNDNSIKLSFKDKDFKLSKLTLNLKYSSNEYHFWRNRIGLSGSAGLEFIYDFISKFGSGIRFNFNINCSVSKLFDLVFSFESVNNRIYTYYNADDKFVFGDMLADFFRSFDFIKGGNKKSSFTMQSYTVSFIHYMNDWTLSISASGKPESVSGKTEWLSEFSILVNWNDIPELKSQTKLSYDKSKKEYKWEKL